MRAVLERTWQLLGEHEREALVALTVFRGGFTPDAAQAAADVGLPLISTLLDQALLTTPAEGRFDLHPLVAAFARSQSGGETLARQRDRHAQHYASVAEAICRQSLSQPRGAIAAFSAEESNLREAWQHAWSQRRWADERPLSGAWRMCCQYAGRYSEAIELLGVALDDEPRDVASQAASARVRGHLAVCMMYRGELDKALAVAQGSIALAKASGERPALINALFVAGHCHHMRNRWSQARQHFEQALAVAQEDGNRQGLASAQNNVGLCARDEGHYDEALASHEQALAGYQELDMPYQVAQCLLNIAEVHKARRDFSLAGEAIERAQRLCREHELSSFVPNLERTLGSLCLETGRLDAARTHVQRALDLAIEQEANESIWDARMDLARVSHRMGLHEDAMERFRELARMAAIGDHDKFILALYFAEYLRDTDCRAEAAQLWRLVSKADSAVSYIRSEARRNLAATQAPEAGDERDDADLPTLLARFLPVA